MNEWFECSVRYEKTLENGMQKYVSEPYLVEAISFTEAEQRFIEEIQPFMSGEYEVKAVSKRKISELFEDDKELADKWFKCKVAFVTLDESWTCSTTRRRRHPMENDFIPDWWIPE